MRYIRHTYADGSVHLFEQYPNGRREISPEQFDYVAWLKEGNVPEEMVTQPAKPVIPVEKTDEEKRAEIDLMRGRAIERIAQAKWTYIDSGFEYAGHKIDTTSESRNLLNAAATRCIIDPDFVFNWKTKGGVYLTLNKELLMGLCIMVSNFVEDAFEKEALLIKKLNMCGALEEIEAVKWEV